MSRKVRLSRRRQRSDAGTGLKARALKAALSGYCNTSQDVADELGVPLRKCQGYVSQFISDGVLRKAHRHIPNIHNKGPRLHVFEVVT
jgi:hypothetical protein